MPTSNQMERDLERVLTNSMGKSIRTGKMADKLTEKQIATLLKYREYYQELPSPRGGKNKIASVWNSVMTIRRLGVFLNKNRVESFEDAKKDNILAYMKSLNGSSDITRSRALTYIRMFYKWIYGIRDKYKVPEIVDDPRLIPEKVKNKKTPKDLLTQEEILKLLEVAGNYRNRAIIMLSIGEGGMRAGEITSLNISSVEFDERGCKVWIEKSKSRERYVRMIKGEPYLREYINKEYALSKSSPSNPLFYGLASYSYEQRLRPTAFTELLHRLAKKAGIRKRIYIHLGRAINISILTKKGMSAEVSAKRFGITAQTLRNVYLTIDDKDVDEAYLRVEGKLSDHQIEKLQKEEDLLMPKKCPRCSNKVSADTLYCNCGMVMDQKEAIKMQEKEEYRERMLSIIKKLSKINPEAIDKVMTVFDRIDQLEKQIKG